MSLNLKKLIIGYDRRTILSDVNLSVEKGAITGILGNNGSGKSTLLKSIVGLAKIFNGEIEINGKSIQNNPTYKIVRSGIAYVSQYNDLIPSLTILEHVKLLSSADETEKFSEFVNMYPWLKGSQNKQVLALSGGQQKTFSILLSSLLSHQVLLLDEPSAGLDIPNTRNIEKLLVELSRTRIVIIAEQNIKFVSKICKKLYMINDGKLNERKLMISEKILS